MSDEVLEALRLRALRGCELGSTEADVADLLGVARETVSRWWSAYTRGGPDALPHQRTGRPPGSGRSLGDDQARHLRALIDAHVPEEWAIPSPLWARRAVQELIRREAGVAMPLRTVGEYLERWGYTPERPRRKARRQGPAEVREWLTKTCPEIEARAAREGAEIHWCDETGVSANERPGRGYARVGTTPEVPVPGERFRVNQVSTVTNQGKVRFMTYTRTLAAAAFLVFLGRLLRGGRKKIFLILDRHPAHEAQAVADWLGRHPGRIELFWLPRRAPELNPGEYLNNDLKGQVNAGGLPETRQELESNFHRFMGTLKKLPGHVMRYFQHPKVQYAAADI
ncbi:MAG TPA: IS630 family transposase [Gemmataceae bacterium]